MASFLIIIFDFEQALQERRTLGWLSLVGLAVIDLILATLGMDLLEDRSRAIDKSWWCEPMEGSSSGWSR